MGRKLIVKRCMAVMHNASANIFYVNFATPLRVCLGNEFMAFELTLNSFNKKYTVLGSL